MRGRICRVGGVARRGDCGRQRHQWAALATWAATYGVDRTSTDPADIINDPDIDIIDVCTPNMVHEELVIAALDAGKHVICEKPLAPTPDAIRRMIAARDRGQAVDDGPALPLQRRLPGHEAGRSTPARWATSTTHAVGCCAATASSSRPPSSTSATAAAVPASTSACTFST
ncbi:MAG: Gfo/Idh/MocA family oxidoreductase [Caldilineaceae bacterium]